MPVFTPSVTSLNRSVRLSVWHTLRGTCDHVAVRRKQPPPRYRKLRFDGTVTEAAKATTIWWSFNRHPSRCACHSGVPEVED